MKLIKFYADWCAPCKALTPLLEELLAGKDISMEEVNIENNMDIVRKYEVRSVPTLVMIDENENKLREFKGYMATPYYRRLIEEFIAG